MTPSGFASDRSSALLDRLAGHARKVSENPDPEAVHDLRVTIRRFTQALRIFAAKKHRAEVKATRAQLRGVMDAAGAVRDRDIALALLAEARVPATAAITGEIGDQRESARAGLKQKAAALTEADFGAQWRSPERFKQRRPVAERAARVLPRSLSSWYKAGRAAARNKPRASTLHRFRIEGKRLRYSMELFEDRYPRTMRRYLKLLKEAQDHLGDYHDCIAVRALLQTIPAGVPHRDRVRRWLAARSTKLHTAFKRFWSSKVEELETRWSTFLEKPRT